MIPLTKRACRQVIKQQRLRITELETQVADLAAQVARLLKNSSTSSKPPSSDIVKPPKPPGPKGGKRHIGGQPGHPRHQREPFAPEQIDRVEKHILHECPDCGGMVRPAAAPARVIQQAELIGRPVEIVEH